jgi:two-component system, NtrC family, response regulator HydG
MKPFRRIIIVDDDRDLAESLAEVLEMRGFEVELAHSGEEGVVKYRKHPFDLVVMDVQMPGMNGLDAFLEMRKCNPAAQVMMMTGFSVEKVLSDALAHGAVGVLHKPFAVADLLAEVEKTTRSRAVLIADDDADFVESIVPIVEERGFAVAVARDGREAVERALGGEFACMILDLRLPVLNGLEVYLELQSRGRQLPTIIVTGYAVEEGVRADALRGAAEDYLVKPIDPSRLLSAIEAQVR